MPDTVTQFEIALKYLLAPRGRPARSGGQGARLHDGYHGRASINPIHQRHFGEHKPASTLIEVKALVDPSMQVEIEAVVYLAT